MKMDDGKLWMISDQLEQLKDTVSDHWEELNQLAELNEAANQKLSQRNHSQSESETANQLEAWEKLAGWAQFAKSDELQLFMISKSFEGPIANAVDVLKLVLGAQRAQGVSETLVPQREITDYLQPASKRQDTSALLALGRCIGVMTPVTRNCLIM